MLLENMITSHKHRILIPIVHNTTGNIEFTTNFGMTAVSQNNVISQLYVKIWY